MAEVPASFEPKFTHDAVILKVRPKRWSIYVFMGCLLIGVAITGLATWVGLFPLAAVSWMLTVLAGFITFALWLPRYLQLWIGPTALTGELFPSSDVGPFSYGWTDPVRFELDDGGHKIHIRDDRVMFGVGPSIEAGGHTPEDVRWLVDTLNRRMEEGSDDTAELAEQRAALQQLATSGRSPPESGRGG